MASVAADTAGRTSDRWVSDLLRDSRGALLLGTFYFAFAASSIAHLGTNTPLWFCNSGAVAWLLQVRGRRWPLLLASIWVADSMAIQFFGAGLGPLMALADTGEVLLTAWLIRRAGGPGVLLTSVLGLLRLILIVLTVPILSAIWGVSVLVAAEGGAFFPHFRQWYAATSLGMLIVCPALLIWLTPELRPTLTRPEGVRLGLLGAGLVALALLLLNLDSPLPLFALFPALLLLVWNSGLAGASVGSAVLAGVGTVATLRGADAIRMLVFPDTSVDLQILAVQALLATLSLSSLPLAVVLADQRRLAAQLRRVAEARSDFLAAMSHEIRTPMTAVLGMVDLLDSEAPTPRQRQQLKGIRDSGRHLVNVLNDILDFSRIETGKIDLERIDFSLPQLLEQVQNALRPLALERGIELKVGLAEQSPPIVRGDPTRIQQILLNLAGNAIKFTPAGSVLVLAAYCPDASGPRFRFEVRDTGIGLAPDQQLQIFDAFTQADHSTSRRYGGSGLGLAICKRLVDLMQGEIGVVSALGEGSQFWFEIPLEPGDVASLAATASAEAGEIIPIRILLAEDVELNRDIICTVLARDGHHVVVAKNGMAAVERVREEPFDLILMDVHMPVMDGLDATRAIRALPGAAAATPIVALTANVMAMEQEKCRLAGMDSVLMKPVEWEQVRAAIRDCTKRRPLAQAVESDRGANGEADEAAFDDTIFAEVEKLIPTARLSEHAGTLLADVRSLADALPDSDRARIQGLAHGIVSQAGMLGLARLSSRAAAVEQACETGESLAAELRSFRAASADPENHLLPRLSRPPP